MSKSQNVNLSIKPSDKGKIQLILLIFILFQTSVENNSLIRLDFNIMKCLNSNTHAFINKHIMVHLL